MSKNISDYTGAAIVAGRPAIITANSDGCYEGFFVDPSGFINNSSAFTASGDFYPLSVTLITEHEVLQKFQCLLSEREMKIRKKDPDGAVADEAWKSYSYDHNSVIDDMNAIRAVAEHMGRKF